MGRRALTRLQGVDEAGFTPRAAHNTVSWGIVLLGRVRIERCWCNNPYPWNIEDKKGVRVRLRWTSREQAIIVLFCVFEWGVLLIVVMNNYVNVRDRVGRT